MPTSAPIARARSLAQMSPQYAFWGSVVPLYPARHQRTLELIGMVLRLAKYARDELQACAVRPPPARILAAGAADDPDADPWLAAERTQTEAHAVARVLQNWSHSGANAAAEQLLRELLMRQAARIAINRTVAGVHYPVDSLAGQMLGLSVAEYILARFKTPGTITTVDGWEFDGSQAALSSADFTGSELVNPATGKRQSQVYAQPIGGIAAPVTSSVNGSANLYWLWDQAAAEW